MSEANCSNCGRPHAPEGYHFPRNIREEKTYCLCIPWTTLDECRCQSILNARSLLVDSRLLLKEERHRAAKILAILALEEVGRAQLAVEHMKVQKDVTFKEYNSAFLDHKSKIEAAQRALNPEEGAWKFRTMLYQDEKFNEQYVDYDWDYKSWSGPRSMDQKLSDARFEVIFRMTGGEKAEEEFNEMREAGAGINKGFIHQLIDQAEKGLNAIDHVLTEKDMVMVSILNLIRGGSVNTPLDAKQILDLIKKAGVNPKRGELQNSLNKYVRWKMLKRSRVWRIRYSATEFGTTGVWEVEPDIKIPPRRFTLSWLEKVADSLQGKRVELAGLISQTRYAKFPTFSLQAPIDFYREQIKEHGESPEARRILTKMLVDELRRDVFSKYSYAVDIAQDANDYLKALGFMNEYATLFGIPFARRQPCRDCASSCTWSTRA